MKPKANILIVEDEAVLYERLRGALIKENFGVAEFTPSYNEAVVQIDKKRPDIVLLDISLQGEKTGLDLGKILNTKYRIPFIYVTEYDDDSSFFEGLETKHAHFMVKTKPVLKTAELIRVIRTVLKNSKEEMPLISQTGIMCLTDYLENIKDFESGQISQIPVSFNEIIYFTTDKSLNANRTTEAPLVNYISVKAANSKTQKLLLNSSLSKLLSQLPDHFARINDAYVVNLKSPQLQGRINGIRIQLADEILTVSNTYKTEFNKRLNQLFLKP
jgi:DNA-binding response OmpR family regulator